MKWKEFLGMGESEKRESERARVRKKKQNRQIVLVNEAHVELSRMYSCHIYVAHMSHERSIRA